MDDDLLLPPRDAPVGELVTVKNHPPTPSRNGQAVSVVWEKVLNDELLQVGHDEVRFCFCCSLLCFFMNGLVCNSRFRYLGPILPSRFTNGGFYSRVSGVISPHKCFLISIEMSPVMGKVMHDCPFGG